jgi:predicted alpha/beta superfamily hydrolase
MKNILSFLYEKQLYFLLSLLFIIVLDLTAQDQVTKPSSDNYPLVSISNTEMRTIHSKILNQEMIIYVKVPVSYYANPQKVYQALYFTDANRSFPMLANMISIFEIPKPVDPEIFIISIGYKINNMAEWGAWRTRDLTPTNVPSVDTYWTKLLTELSGKQYNVKTGGAEIFLDFIIKEVFPFVESNYRVSATDRGLGGYSYGGLFSLYVLLRQPDLFSFYYAGSPSIGFDKGVLFNYEKEYATTHKDLNAKLFMSAGGSEDTLMINNLKKMADLLKSRNYPGLSVETYVFPGETHQSCYPSSIMRALRVLYKR